MNGGLCLMFVLAASQVGETSRGNKVANHNIVMVMIVVVVMMMIVV